MVEVFVAGGAKEPVALGGTFHREVLVLLFAPLPDAQRAAVPCIRFGQDWTVALVTVVL